MTLFEALTGGAFDRLNWQHSGEFDEKFSKESNARGFAREGMGGFGIDLYIIKKPGNTQGVGTSFWSLIRRRTIPGFSFVCNAGYMIGD